MNAGKYIRIALFFVILGGAGAGYVILSSNGISALNTNAYNVILEDATGLSTRSKVYLAGVPVGKVQGIQLNGTEARLKVTFLNDIVVYQDAVISRKSSSLLGTSVLSLDPGTEPYPILPPGSLIKSLPPAGDLSSAMTLVEEIGGQVTMLVEELRTNQLALLAVSLETFNSIAQKFDAQAEAQLDSLSRILEAAATISERTNRILQSNEGALIASFSELNEAAANIRSITGEIASGRGNFGQAIYGDGLYRSILSTVEKTDGTVDKLGEALDNISTLVKTTDEVMTDAGEVVKKAMGLGVQVDANARYDFLSQTTRTAASIRLDPASNDRWYRVGITSTPDGVTSRTVKETTDSAGNIVTEDTTETQYTVAVDAELARKIGLFTLRGGLMESTAGIGIDIQPLKWLSLSGELFNFQDGERPNLRSSITFYPFFDPDSDKPWNWIYLKGGVSDALNGDRDFFLGGGLRFADREVKGLVGLVPAFN